MKLIKLMAAIAFMAAVCVATAEVKEIKKGGCCDKAKKDGKDCAHPCCVEAAKEKKICEKCNAPKKDKK
ncbi:MAG: hypothetical protein HZA89_06420 [Verrucomicrobia bacterium]|nr:hypothetical protein [Verrucomicrobiota bacterium]